MRFNTPGTAGGRGGPGVRVSNNVYYNADNDVLYPAASVGVKRCNGKSKNKTDVSTKFSSYLYIHYRRIFHINYCHVSSNYLLF